MKRELAGAVPGGSSALLSLRGVLEGVRVS